MTFVPSRSLLAAIAGRLLGFVATLLGAMALLLALMVLAPGAPIDDPNIAAQFGLDQPPLSRWTLWFGRMVVLDLGTSYAYRPGAPVTEVIATPAVRTVGLVLGASGLVLALGAGLAAATAGRHGIARAAIQGVGLIAGFVLAHLAVSLFNETTWWAVGRGLIERPSWFALPDQPSALRTAIAITVLAVGSGALPEVHADLEDALVKIRQSPWVDAARARGATLWPAILRAMVPPLAATLSNRAALLVGGAVVIEKVLLLQGAGTVLWEATRLRDHELAISIGVLCAGLVATTRLVADGIRIAVDPRLREARS